MRRKITMRINLIAWIVGTERRVNDGSGDGILCIVVAVCKGIIFVTASSQVAVTRPQRVSVLWRH